MPCVIPQPMHCGRRLCELLEEQQEPFLLDVYLLEHGFSDTALRGSPPFKCWPCRNLISRLGAYGFKRTIKRGGLLRFLVNKLVYNTKVIRETWICQRAAASGCTWSGRWSSLCGSIFEIKGKTNVVEFQRLSYSDEGDLDLEKWRALSPVSVLEHHHSGEAEEEAPSTSNVESPKETNEGSWICHGPENGGTRKRHFFEPHYGVLGSLTEGKFSACHQCSDSERKAKMIKEEILFSWENPLVAVADISNLVDFDLSKSKKNWSRFQQEVREIVTEIEHTIFDEMREETLLDIILGFQCTQEIC